MGPVTDMSCPVKFGGTRAVVEATGMRFIVGLSDVIPQQNAGLRSDPPMSLPSPNGLMPDAMAAASPPDDPPAVCSNENGFRVSPYKLDRVCTRSPKSGKLVRPIGIAPATRNLATLGAS